MPSEKKKTEKKSSRSKSRPSSKKPSGRSRSRTPTKSSSKSPREREKVSKSSRSKPKKDNKVRKSANREASKSSITANSKVYNVPPAKDNLNHITSDEMFPILGGYTHTLPGPIPAPLSAYNTAVANTPKSTSYKRIIPFDSSTDKFVFGAIQDKIFKKRYDRKAFRSKILREFDKA
jgi:hypothetical protein